MAQIELQNINPLFHDVQLNHILPDGKTFVDSLPKSAIEEINANKEEFWLSPNPATEKVTLQLGSKSGMKQVTITEINGSTVYQQSTGLNEFELDITSYHPGLYLVTISDLKEIRTLKLIIL